MVLELDMRIGGWITGGHTGADGMVPQKLMVD
jgi:hypothetical protein